MNTFGTAVDVTLAEPRLEAFLPVDEASAAALDRLARKARVERNRLNFSDVVRKDGACGTLG